MLTNGEFVVALKRQMNFDGVKNVVDINKTTVRCQLVELKTIISIIWYPKLLLMVGMNVI
jgi:hypothetical protein